MSTTAQPPIPKRRWHQFSLLTLLVVVTAATVAFGGWVQYRRAYIQELNWASRRIEDKHAERIKLLTEFLVSRPDWETQRDNWEEENRAIEQLGEAFSDEAFYSVSIGIDGHHGMTSLKKWSQGPDHILTHGSRFVEGAKPEHRVSMGWSTTGEKFYVYEAWVPEAKYMRYFSFWVHRSSLEEDDSIE